jgi:methyl coenzyme M reductase subunit D
MSQKEVEVKRIVLNIRGKEISLSLEEAKELSEVLNEMFETKRVVREITKEPYPWSYYVTWFEHKPYSNTTWTLNTRGAIV